MPRAAAAMPETPTITINQTVQPKEETPPEKEKTKGRPELWTYMASLSPADWRRHVAYLYRTRPIVGINQREKYLAVLSEPFTIEDVKHKYGGEEFRVMLIRDGKPMGDYVFGIEAAPKYDLSREVPSRESHDNSVVQTLVEKLTEKNENSNVEGAVQRSMDIMGNAFDSAVKRIATSGGDKGNLLETITALKELGLIGQPAPQGNSILETIKVLGALGLIKTEPADPMKNLESTLAIFARMQEFSGGGGKTDWKTELGSKLLEKAPQLIDGISNIGKQRVSFENARRERIQAAEQAARTIQNAGGPAAVAAQVNVQAPAPSAAAPSAPAVSAPISTVAMPDGNAPAPAHSVTFAQLGYQRLVQMVYSGENGGACLDFLYGLDPQAWEFIVGCDEAGIRAALASDPLLARILEYPNVNEFIAQMLEYSAEVVADNAQAAAAGEAAPVTH